MRTTAELMGPPSRQHDQALRVAKGVAEMWGVSVETIMGRGRGQRVCAAREVAHYLAHELTGLPYTHLAVLFDRDHATIHAACSRVRRRIGASEAFGGAIELLVRGLRAEEEKGHVEH